MERMHSQRGMSGFGVVIILAVIGYAAFIALQYIPQAIENGSVDTILENLEDMHDDLSHLGRLQRQDGLGKRHRPGVEGHLCHGPWHFFLTIIWRPCPPPISTRRA